MSLILGHGELYIQTRKIHNSPIYPQLWLTKPYTSVDKKAAVLPDIVYDLKHTPWVFAANNTYTTIIDKTGTGLMNEGGKTYSEKILDEVWRVLKVGGIFYGHNGITIKKDTDSI